MGRIDPCNSKLPSDTCPGTAAIRILSAEIDECGQDWLWSMPINLGVAPVDQARRVAWTIRPAGKRPSNGLLDH
jgi:hypothetical protein